MLREWQRKIIRRVYGRVNSRGLRIARTALLTMGRKNGKTELIACLCLCHLCSEVLAETGGQIYSAAADRDQAALVFHAAVSMVRSSEDLSEILNVLDSKKRIVHIDSGSFYQAISSESKTKHGFNASVILYDELAQAPNRDLYDVLTTSVGARAQPLTWVISTMSADPVHIMSELVDYGRKVQAGTIVDPTFVPFIFEVPKELDAFDENNWPLANPALGDFRSLEEMRNYARRAQSMPAAESTFRNLYLNQAVDAAESWIKVADWQKCEAYIELEEYQGAECFGGLDLSGKNDLTALALVFPTEAGFDAVPLFWAPDDGLRAREDRDRVPYTLWKSQGHLQTTPGRSIDYADIALKIVELTRVVKLKAIAFDRYRIDDLMREFDRIGFRAEIVKPGDEALTSPELILIPHGQGYRDMSPAVDVIDTAILNGELRVQKNPVLTMCALNAVLTIDPAGSKKFDKRPGKSTGRIDGIVALAMALRCATGIPRAGVSIYETRGLLTL